jgi:hypothetical protein
MTDYRRSPQEKLGLGLGFPPEVFSSVWLFVGRDGSRGLRPAILEASTCSPKALAVVRGDLAGAPLVYGRPRCLRKNATDLLPPQACAPGNSSSSSRSVASAAW